MTHTLASGSASDFSILRLVCSIATFTLGEVRALAMPTARVLAPTFEIDDMAECYGDNDLQTRCEVLRI